MCTEAENIPARSGLAQASGVYPQAPSPDHRHSHLMVDVGAPESADGPSKRLAERDAAEKMLIREGVWEAEA